MFRKINNWLLKPYPAIITIKQKILFGLVFGKIVFLFLYIFIPFDMGKLDNDPLQYALGFGLITFAVFLFNAVLSPIIFTKFHNPNKWTIGKTTIFFLITILFIGIANWYYNLKVARPKGLLENSLGYYIILTFLVGLFPMLFYIYISERKANKQRNSVAKKLSDTIKDSQIARQNESEKKATITLVAENQKDKFSFGLQNLLFINSEGNYASIFYVKNKSVKEEVIRNSLNSIESQLATHKSVVRCHKSYIVNTQQVLKMQGNARGYFLQFPKIDFLIPVSRTFPKEFLYTLIK